MSLVELLVVVPLLLAVFGLVLSLLMPGLRAWGRSEQHAEAQQGALLAATRISRAVYYASPDALVVSNATGLDATGLPARHDTLVLVTDLGQDDKVHLDPMGLPWWQAQVAFYYDAAARAIRVQERALDAPTTDPPPTEATVTADAADPIVANNIRSLSLKVVDGPAVDVTVEADVQGYRSSITTRAGCLLETVGSPP